MDDDWHSVHAPTCLTEWRPGRPPLTSWLRRQYKCYQRFRHVDLPRPTIPLAFDFAKLSSLRRSAPSIATPPPLEALSAVFHLALGSAAGPANTNTPSTDKTPYPSAGGLYPIEVYLLVPAQISTALGVASALPPGTYHWCARTAQLEVLASDLLPANIEAVFGSGEASSAPFVVLTAVPRRTCSKYGLRGYRYALLEAGHIGQQLYLACAALEIKCCAIGAFIEDVLAEQLFLRPEVEVPVYVLRIGL